MAQGLPRNFGRFEVTSELGRGAMGLVYRAEDPTLGRTVAIKTIALTGASHEREAHEARFFQEARAAGGLSHPSIITIFDVGREGDTAFIAMELLEGRELRELIRSRSLSPARSVEIAAAVAEGLAFAHERGVIHRDVKPGNIMVCDDGRVKVTDFGIARLSASTVKTQSGAILGSPQYVAPEQIGGRGFDHRSDLFSLGVVLYEMLTGSRPFEGEEVTEVLFAIANNTPKPPSHLVPGLPPVLDYIVARALKKNPDERYASGAEFAADLRACLASMATAEASPPAPAAEREVRDAPAAVEPGTTASGPIAMPAARLELRPSPHFDASEVLARLAPAPPSPGGEAPATKPAARARRRMDRDRALVAVAYALAVAGAVAIFLA